MAARPLPQQAFHVGDWQVMPLRGQIRRGDTSVSLEPKVMQLLCALAESAGEVVTRDRLYELLWGSALVSDHALTRMVSELRGALHTADIATASIETIPKVGYRLALPVRRPDRSEAGPAAPVQDTATAGRGWRRMPLLLVIAAAAVFWGYQGGLVSSVQPAGTVLVASSEPGIEHMPALSPDGSLLIYRRDGRGIASDLVIRSADNRQYLELPADNGRFGNAVWAADSHRFRVSRFDDSGCRIMEYRMLEQSLEPVRPCAGTGRGWDWHAATDHAVFVVEEGASGQSYLVFQRGDETPVPISGDPLRADVHPNFSPDGRQVAFLRRSGPFAQEIWLLALGEDGSPVADGSGTPRPLTDLGWRVAGLDWTASGDHLIFSASEGGAYQLYRLDIRSGAVTWLPLPGAEDAGAPSIAADGQTMVFSDWEFDYDIMRLSLQPPAGRTPVLDSTEWDYAVHRSVDGGQLVWVSERSGQPQIWLAEADGANPRQLTQLPRGLIGILDISPDGRRLAFDHHRDGRSMVYVLDLVTTSLWSLPSSAATAAPTFSPDGRALLYAADHGQGWQIWQQSLADTEAVPLQLTDSGAYHGRWLETDRVLLFTRDNRPGIWRLDRDSGEETLIIGNGVSANNDMWQLQDNHIFYLGYEQGFGLYRHNLDDDSTERLVDIFIGLLPAFPGLEVDADHSHVTLSLTTRAEANLKRVENLPALLRQ